MARLFEKGFISEQDLEPEKDVFMDFYLMAFAELNSCRSMGMGLGPIPFTSIWEYSRIYDVEDFDEFLYIVRVMDYKLLDLQDKQTKKAKEANGPGNKKNPNKSVR